MSQVYRCAACHVDSSGVLSFAQHCGGKAHRSAAGFAGFAGLEANAAGITPPVDDALLRACGGGAAAGGGGKAATRGAKDKAGADKGKPPKGEPGVVAVSLTDENHANIRSALQARCAPSTPSRPLTPPQRSASETGLAASVPQAAAGPPPWRAKSRGGGEGGGGGEAGPSYVAAAPAASSLHKSASTPVLSSGAVLPAPRGVDGAPRAAEGAGGAGPRVEVYRRGGGDGPAPATRPPLGPRGGGGGVPAPPPALATSRADVAEMLRVRAQLPAAAFAAQICAAVASHPVVIVQGETGCGKSTQVPQFLLQEAAERCTSCNIICTQPRRISAIGVAERVAAERCERIGGAVGYTIRLESATSAATRLLFCTTGILLRRLEEDPTLADVSHVLVDECAPEDRGSGEGLGEGRLTPGWYF